MVIEAEEPHGRRGGPTFALRATAGKRDPRKQSVTSPSRDLTIGARRPAPERLDRPSDCDEHRRNRDDPKIRDCVLQCSPLPQLAARHSVIARMTRHGLPAANTASETSRVTTLPAPITAREPISYAGENDRAAAHPDV